MCDISLDIGPLLNKTNKHADDKHILSFLRGCKFSLERTKEKFDMYYSVRSACPEWFTDWDPADPMVREFLDVG